MCERLSSERAIGVNGHWNVDLLINPRRVELLLIALKINALTAENLLDRCNENGHVLKKYDGLTTGQGTGVKGDTKDSTGVTTSTMVPPSN